MRVRNFYVRGKADGRRTEFTGGPQSKEGGLRITITQRDKGEVTTACTVACREEDGQLITIVYDSEGTAVYRYATER